MKSFLFLLPVSLLFAGCYTVQQGFSMIKLLSQAVPLEKLAQNNAETQVFADRVADIKDFAISKGLKKTKNYTRYVELDRHYLASIVSGCAKDSFTRYEWWFPLVGKVPYKGFFNEADAQSQAEQLKKKDLDVLIRRVDAFSTLGWFSDPLYSYMKDYPVHHLADLIIHETVHATVYLAGQSQFNEELAEFVGSEGTRLYMADRFGRDSPEYAHLCDSQADRAAFIAFIQELIRQLEALYASGIARAEKLAQKELIIKGAQERFDRDYESLFKSDSYRFFSKMTVNNAYLELFRLYYDGSAYLQQLYERSGSDLRTFIAAAKTIKGTKDPRGALEKALSL
ncbi:MAG: aminopeptidase [Spirochaetaceae bacterium]|jgi:predicted aminopeptidase|nr:aminopeptidase [Spirochaetaceae bacterium]